MFTLPYELYEVLPKEREYFEESNYAFLPRQVMLRLIDDGLKRGELELRNGLIFARKRLTPIERVKKECYPAECINYILNNSKTEFYQGRFVEFKNKYLRRLIKDIPLVKEYQYLWVGAGHCIIDCLEELTDGELKDNFWILDIDEDVVNFYRKRNYRAYYSDIRFLSNAIIPYSNFDVVISYHIEFYQTYEILKFIAGNIRDWGTLYLSFAYAELEDKEDFYSIFETLDHFNFNIVEFTPFYIKAIKLV